MRRGWISQINAAVREHGFTYSRFANCLVKKSNLELDRKILGSLALTEPFTFKAVLDEVKMQAGVEEVMKRKPMIVAQSAVSFPEAMSKGLLMPRTRPEHIKAILNDEP